MPALPALDAPPRIERPALRTDQVHPSREDLSEDRAPGEDCDDEKNAQEVLVHRDGAAIRARAA